MGFLIYKRTSNGGSIRYEKLKPLKLGGTTGVIAQHVKSLGDDEARSWKLEAASLLQFAGLEPKDNTVLFDVAGPDATNVCLYELSRIHGSCRDTSTQLALDFSVVLDQEAGDDAAALAASFEVTPPAKLKRLGETLSLSGGPGGGDWKWGAPPMQLGATVVHAHDHQGGSCANCTCGRGEPRP